MKTFTKEQEAALSAFESAAESHDLHAFGNGRKHYAHAAVVARFEALEVLGITDALTWREHAQVRDSKSFLA